MEQYPDMFRVRQKLERPTLDDMPATVAAELAPLTRAAAAI